MIHLINGTYSMLCHEVPTTVKGIFTIHFKVGLVDIETVARVPLNVFVYLSKVWKIRKNLFGKIIASALVTIY
jgi:hypothetical protein